MINRLKENNQYLPEKIIITVYEENNNMEIHSYEFERKVNL
jgi:hypothetical protein